MTNPFECGTLAHNAWESRSGESNCEENKCVREKKRGGGIPAPHWGSLEDFRRACGLSKKTNKP